MRFLTENPVTGALASLGFIGLTGALAPFVHLSSLKDPRGSDGLLHFWGRQSLRLAGVKSTVIGLENIPERTCVFVGNHQSHFDGLLNFAYIRKHIRYVAKRQLFEIPLFGPALRAAGNIEVNREGGEKDRATLEAAIRTAQERTSVMFYPEGTRSEDGELKPFRKGAAIFAIQAQMPIVPLAVAGTHEILRKKSPLIRRGCRAALAVGEPISTEGLTLNDRDELTARTRDAVAKLMERAEAARAGL